LQSCSHNLADSTAYHSSVCRCIYYISSRFSLQPCPFSLACSHVHLNSSNSACSHVHSVLPATCNHVQSVLPAAMCIQFSLACSHVHSAYIHIHSVQFRLQPCSFSLACSHVHSVQFGRQPCSFSPGWPAAKFIPFGLQPCSHVWPAAMQPFRLACSHAGVLSRQATHSKVWARVISKQPCCALPLAAP
jgi:hypothetical protein